MPKFDNKEATDPVIEGVQTSDTSKPVVANAIRSRDCPGFCTDALYMTERVREEKGISDVLFPFEAAAGMPGDKIIAYIRNPAEKLYADKEPDRVDGFRNDNDSGKLLTDKDGNQIKAAEMIAVTISRDEWNAQQDAHNKATHEFTKSVIERKLETLSAIIKNFDGSQEQLQNQYQQAHHQLQSPGMLEKWPGNMKYPEVLARQGWEKTTRLEFDHVRGGRSEKPGEFEEYRKSRGKNRTTSAPGRPTR